MPKLPTYTAQLGASTIAGGRRAEASDLAPSGLTEFGVTGGRAAADYQQGQEEDESRRVLVRQAEIRAKYAKALDDAALNGGDVNKIREQLDNELSTVTENLTTRKALETAQIAAANTGAVFDSEANRLLRDRAKAEVKVQGTQLIRDESTLVQRDPSRLKDSEVNVSAFIDTFKGRLSPQDLAEAKDALHKDLNVAAAIAVARTNPTKAKELAEAGEWNLSAAQREVVIDKADTEIRAQETQKRLARADADYQRREESDKAADGYFKQIMTGGFSMRAALDDPKLERRDREHIILMADARAKALAGQERKSNQTVYKDLYMRYTAPDGTPGKLYSTDAIYEAVKAGDINTGDSERLRGIAFAQKDENGRNIGARLNALTRRFDHDVANNIRVQGMAQADNGLPSEISNVYVARVTQRMEELRKSNVNPNEVFDEKSKSFVGSREFTQGVINDVLSQKTPAKAPTIKTQAEYDALPPGSAYVDSRGNAAVKPGKK